MSCWRRVRAQRCAFLIDVDAYFATFAAVARRARHSIVIAGWDFNGRVELWKGRRHGLPNRVGEFLRALVERRQDLHVYILEWDFAALYALDRELLPRYRWDWRDHERIHFELDGCHPTGCSHHQKIVVIDDALAFVGGIDFGPGRWDTSRHAARDSRRVDWRGESYRPFHDVQMAVGGRAAGAVGELVRERWRRATGYDLPPAVDDPGIAVWPPELYPDLTDASIAIARTLPAYEGRPEVREVERSYLELIDGARRIVYIENQYLTAASIGAAIERRLRELDGPEFVLVIRRECSGWLEQNVMGALRARLVERLRAADHAGRLHVYSAESGNRSVDVHAKVMIVDDDSARVGSANLNNRSMGVDSECDLIVESEGCEEARRAIAALRQRLLADHLGVDAPAVAAAVERCGGHAAAIAELADEKRPLRLVPLQVDADAWGEGLISATRLADPEKPLDFDTLAALLEGEIDAGSYRGALVAALVLLAAAVLLALAWHWSLFGAVSAGVG